jgi:hypothetical protein
MSNSFDLPGTRFSLGAIITTSALISCAAYPRRRRKGLGRYDIPVTLLARLAVAHREQDESLAKLFP